MAVDPAPHVSLRKERRTRKQYRPKRLDVSSRKISIFQINPKRFRKDLDLSVFGIYRHVIITEL